MAEFEGYTGVWRRLKSGAAIFIRDGEDIKSAIRRNKFPMLFKIEYKQE